MRVPSSVDGRWRLHVYFVGKFLSRIHSEMSVVCKNMGASGCERDEEEWRGLCCSVVQPSDLLLSCGATCSATRPVQPAAPHPRGSRSAQRLLFSQAPVPNRHAPAPLHLSDHTHSPTTTRMLTLCLRKRSVILFQYWSAICDVSCVEKRPEFNLERLLIL